MDGMRQHLAGRTRQRVGPINAPQLDAADGAGYAPGDALFRFLQPIFHSVHS
jgi:hypothetical protein